jgi:hypothetical protein
VSSRPSIDRRSTTTNLPSLLLLLGACQRATHLTAQHELLLRLQLLFLSCASSLASATGPLPTDGVAMILIALP